MSIQDLIRSLAESAGEQLASGDVERARRTLTWRAEVRDEVLTSAEFEAQCHAHVQWLQGNRTVTA